MKNELKQLEARLARVEKELAELKANGSETRNEPWYRLIVGDFANDKSFAEIVRLGKAIRRERIKD